MADIKPLPNLPNLNIATLSTDARRHRSQIISQRLSEVQETTIAGRQEEWLHAFEQVLDAFSLELVERDWLHAIKSTRQAQCLAKTKGDDQTEGEASSSTVTGKPNVSLAPVAQLVLPSALPSPLSDDATQQILDQLRKLLEDSSLVKNTTPQESQHLLLCLSPFDTHKSTPSEESGFAFVPPNVAIGFVPKQFTLSPQSSADARYDILYGLSEWIDTYSSNPPTLIGGTFTLKGINTPEEHEILRHSFRAALYLHLSLLLEQQLLLDLGIPLLIEKPKPIELPASTPPISIDQSLSNGVSFRRHRHSFLSQGILSFFSKKNLVGRPTSESFVRERRGSLDSSQAQVGESARGPFDGSPRQPFSFIDKRLSFLRVPQAKEPLEPPCSEALRRIRASENLLSTSIGVSFVPPKLLIQLAGKEKDHANRRLNGDERAGLASLLGWEGKESRGKNMAGTAGFIRHQELSVLFVLHAPKKKEATRAPSDSSPPDTLAQIVENIQPRFSPCTQPQLITYYFYSFASNQDFRLGEVIHSLVSSASDSCTTPGCQSSMAEHELRFIHAGLRVIARLGSLDAPSDSASDQILMWDSCAICGAQTEKTEMSDGTYLFSFAKFLELLFHSTTLCRLSASVCDHVSPPPEPWPALPDSRLNIVRHFEVNGRYVKFSLSTTDDIFEIRVPRLQMVRGLPDKPIDNSLVHEDNSDDDGEEQRKALRREIKSWWENISDHVDKMERYLMVDEEDFIEKSLPRLPSSDDAYDEVQLDPPTTPRRDRNASLPSLPPPDSPLHDHEVVPPAPFPSPSTPHKASPSVVSSKTQATTDVDPKELLSRLRQTFHRSEQSLYAQLSQTQPHCLNDVRRTFLAAGRGAEKRLLAWQKKHLPSLRNNQLGEEFTAEEPSWWGKGSHVLPGCNLIVREDDWGSMIAFTLGSMDYENELLGMSPLRSGPASPTLPSSPATATSSAFTTSTGFKLFTSSQRTQPDPDTENIIWYETDPYSAVVSRIDHPRDPTGILSIRNVLAQTSMVDLPATRVASIGSSASRLTTPPSAWTKPEVQVNTEPVGGEVAGMPEASELAEKILQGIDSTPTAETQAESVAEDGTLESTESAATPTPGSKAGSTISSASKVTIGQASRTLPPTPPDPPPKEDIQGTPSTHERRPPLPSKASSMFTNTLTSSINYAMRFVMNNDNPNFRSTPLAHHHALLTADSRALERPHIKHDWTVGKRLKFSCTVYYAMQFDILRRRCGIEDTFLKSLAQSTNWRADGGKSRSNFWKTTDDRFIIKTLVNAWNVADLQFLIDLAPSYFRYMDSTASKATVLAKMVGFYTIEIRNLETGNVQSKADLLVMENLFYGRNISRTFDLKGIQGRKVKPSGRGAAGRGSKTLFDGEWIEGQQKTLMLIQPYSKAILKEAIRSDAEFLAKSNIMDYSLLLGVDEEKKQIACGLVDTIGSYTFAKTLEYKAKQGLNSASGKEVTVIPPAEYQERFVNALERYFLACPDKWSKPHGEYQGYTSIDMLPCPL